MSKLVQLHSQALHSQQLPVLVGPEKMHSRGKARLEGDGAEQKDDNVVDSLGVLKLERELVYINLLQIGLDLLWIGCRCRESEQDLLVFIEQGRLRQRMHRLGGLCRKTQRADCICRLSP